MLRYCLCTGSVRCLRLACARTRSLLLHISYIVRTKNMQRLTVSQASSTGVGTVRCTSVRYAPARGTLRCRAVTDSRSGSSRAMDGDRPAGALRRDLLIGTAMLPVLAHVQPSKATTQGFKKFLGASMCLKGVIYTRSQCRSVLIKPAQHTFRPQRVHSCALGTPGWCFPENGVNLHARPPLAIFHAAPWHFWDRTNCR